MQGIKQDPNALGYFGYAYYEANQDDLKALAIARGDGAVLPSRQTVEAGNISLCLVRCLFTLTPVPRRITPISKNL